jgi:hypothetical protein
VSRVAECHGYPHRALIAATLLAIAAAWAAAPICLAQDDPISDAEGDASCKNLGVYIFVGGTGGFDGLEYGDRFPELLKTGHVGLYQHANAVVAAEQPPSVIRAIEKAFVGTGPGQAELGQVGANYFTLPPSYDYYQAVYIENGLHPTEANVNTPSDAAAPGQLDADLKQWREYVDAARTAGIRTIAPVVGPNDPNEPKLGENVFATNPYYALERGEALYGGAMAFDVPPNFSSPAEADQVTENSLCRPSSGATRTACAPPCCCRLIPGPTTQRASRTGSPNSPAIRSPATRRSL